jgi:UDPglucose 6-dehydrogenase
MRDAPSRDIIALLQGEGARVRAYDPVAADNARRLLSGVELCQDPYQTAKDCDAVVLVTEWNEFKHLDMATIKQSMKYPVLVDGRNLYDPEEMVSLGFDYRCIGRGVIPSRRQAE